ncbi:MAG TPA: histidine phosphatase family protein [Dokdonella sp.]
MSDASLWLIRHAPVAGAKGIIHGPDAPADLRDVAAFAALKARLPAVSHAVCSPARRTVETARALGLNAAELAAFREQDFGAWTGRRHDELAAEQGEAYREFWRAPAENAVFGGESFVGQIARARAGIEALPSGHSILVVHSGTIRAILSIALDLAPEAALRFVVDPLSLTRIDRLAGGWRIVEVNWRRR